MLMNRRTMLRVALSTTGSAAATAILAACGGDTIAATPTPATGSAPATLAATPLPRPSVTIGATTSSVAVSSPTAMISTGKTIPELKVGVQKLPATMDPQETNNNIAIRVFYSHYDTLIRRDFLDGNKLVPSLATEWKRTDDKTLEMSLRRDVKWHDGTPFTAADVKYTFDRILGKDPKLIIATPAYFPLASIEQLDDYRVRFVSTAIDPIMEKRFAGIGAQIIPVAYHKQVGADTFRTKSIGTGPYKLVEFRQDDHITFEANDVYFGGAPAARRVTFRQIPEVATRVAAIGNGEVDIITNVPPDQIAPLSMRKDITVTSVPIANINTLVFNMKAKPFDKREIRQAISYAIDRKALTEQLFAGYATWTRGYQFEGEDFYDANRPQTPYDLGKAKQLLQQGGYAGEQIVYSAYAPSYYTLEREVGEAIIDMWRKAGINGKLEFGDLATKEQTFDEKNYHAETDSSNDTTADPDGYLWRIWGPDALYQQKGWWASGSAAEFNRLGQEARTTLDRAKRAMNYQRMIDIFETEAPGTTLYDAKEPYALRTSVDWIPYPLYYMDLRAYNFKVR